MEGSEETRLAEEKTLNERLEKEKQEFEKGVKSAKELGKEEKSETVSLDIEKEKDDTKDETINIKVNSGGIGSLKKFIGNKTKEHELAEDKEEKDEEVKDDKILIGSYISEDEFKLIASVLIILIDTVIVNIFKFWSGDHKDSSYGLSKPKKNELTDILAQILKKHNVKWSLELLFVFLLVLGYSQQGIKAYEARVENQKSKKALSVVNKPKTKTENSSETEQEETHDTGEETKNVLTHRHSKKKKGVGRPSGDAVEINPQNVREAA